MVVIVQQGKAKIVAMPGVVIGISDEQNMEYMKNQQKGFAQMNDHTTKQLIEDDPDIETWFKEAFEE